MNFGVHSEDDPKHFQDSGGAVNGSRRRNPEHALLSEPGPQPFRITKLQIVHEVETSFAAQGAELQVADGDGRVFFTQSKL